MSNTPLNPLQFFKDVSYVDFALCPTLFYILSTLSNARLFYLSRESTGALWVKFIKNKSITNT
jgi:hypothetical protein